MRSSTPYKVGKPVGNGTTHKIREQLNFSDEKKWKEFSGRRLELIDKFGLSERKASEQDDNIKQIATILRTEFGYPLSCANEFEKLVTAAVQSVRRNRKRSKKRSCGSGSCTSDEEITRMSSPSQAVLPVAPTAPSSVGPPILQKSTIVSPPTKIPVIQSQQMYDDIVKSIISDLVNNTIPLNQQSLNDGDGPNLTDFALSTNDRNLLSLGLKNCSHRNPSPILPFFLREKILLQIQRSRTCFDMAFSQGSVELYGNLALLGEMATRSSIVFVVERFFSNLVPSSMEYITSKISSQESLSNLSHRLFDPATKRNLSQLPSLQVQLKVLFLVTGGLVKDFGFDPCLYPLSEVIHHLAMLQYPLLTNENPLSQNSTYGQRTAVISSLSIKPQIANRDVNKKVFIRFKEKEHQFTFHLLSNGPPTINEILESCKQLFRILCQSKLLALYHEGKLIHEDPELARLFSSLTNESIVLELRELSSSPQSKPTTVTLAEPKPSKSNELDGLKMLSAASLQVKRELATPLPPLPPPSPASSSQTVLDNIINRIGGKSPMQGNQSESSNELPSLPNVVNNSNRNFFQNGNLPQPVFQPLL